MQAKAPNRANGIVTEGITVAGKFLRKINIAITTRIIVIKTVPCKSLIDLMIDGARS
jgi:hypothetical protein